MFQDIDKSEAFRKEETNEEMERYFGRKSKINQLSHFQFFIARYKFYGIDFHVKGNAIELEYGIGCFYFPVSLNKTFYDLGGRFVDFNNQEVENWKIPKSWGKLKHWDDYKWYNRPRR